MSFVAQNLSRSGLCDKLVDVTLLHTLALCKNKVLHLASSLFNVFHHNGQVADSRKQDVLYENMIQCVTFAPTICIDQTPEEPKEVCTDYFGGCRPIVELYDKLFGTCSDVSLATYLSYLEEPILQFRPELLQEAMVVDDGTWIGVHLRRTDKVSNGNPDFGQMSSSELALYNERTYLCLEDCINRGFRQFYLASDDKDVLQTFALFLQNTGCTVKWSEDAGWKKTYIDLMNLSRCKAILMSCRHSNFSIVASLLGRNRKIITVWEYCEAKEYMTTIVQWNAIIDFIPYSNVSKTKIAMLGHQGVADFYNQNGLFHLLAGSFLDAEVTILLRAESERKMVQTMFPHFHVEVANTLQTQTNLSVARACLVCHTSHPLDWKTCVAHAPVRFVNEPHYEERGIHLVMLNGFSDYPSWCKVYCDGRPFNVAFYMYNHLQEHVLRSRFAIPEVPQLHTESEYDVICHDDPQRGFTVHAEGKNVFKCNQKSEIMMDLLSVFKGANEFHFIDSSYSVLIWCCQHKYNWFKDKKIVLHNSCRGGRDIGIYTHRLPKNWQIV